MVANAIPIVKTGKNPDSIKTRIETRVLDSLSSRLLSSKNPDSIKTRIETLLYPLHILAVQVVRTLIPLKQG